MKGKNFCVRKWDVKEHLATLRYVSFFFFISYHDTYHVYIHTHQQQHWSGTPRVINSTELKRRNDRLSVQQQWCDPGQTRWAFQPTLWTTADVLTANYYVIKARKRGWGGGTLVSPQCMTLFCTSIFTGPRVFPPTRPGNGNRKHVGGGIFKGL